MTPEKLGFSAFPDLTIHLSPCGNTFISSIQVGRQFDLESNVTASGERRRRRARAMAARLKAVMSRGSPPLMGAKVRNFKLVSKVYVLPNWGFGRNKKGSPRELDGVLLNTSPRTRLLRSGDRIGATRRAPTPRGASHRVRVRCEVPASRDSTSHRGQRRGAWERGMMKASSSSSWRRVVPRKRARVHKPASRVLRTVCAPKAAVDIQSGRKRAAAFPSCSLAHKVSPRIDCEYITARTASGRQARRSPLVVAREDGK